MPRTIHIKVPASSANIGPGFDVLGIALNLYLEVTASIDAKRKAEAAPHNCTVENSGLGAENLPTNSEQHLVTRVALYVLRCHGIRAFPVGTHIKVHNSIPLGRGLGSSGAAVVAGVMLGSEIGQLNLPRDRLMDFCLMIERHPDNIAAALYGGFVGSFLRELSGTELERVEIPLAEVLPAPSGGVDTGRTPPEPPLSISHSVEYPLSSSLKCVCVIPEFEVSTAKSRDVLPDAYTRKDAIFNLQRLSVLIASLAQTPVKHDLVYLAMQDKLHQRYRQILVPGLKQILESMTPRTTPGLAGVCLSGAGPTVLALATDHFDEIADDIKHTFEAAGVKCTYKILEPAAGASVTIE